MNNYKYVNTRMGTQNDFRFSNGNVLPITAIPYGMASFTIQTEIGKKRGWFYSPYSKSFEGIRLTHQPSPWLGDYGELIIYGQNGKIKTEDTKRWSYYNNEKCVLEPAYMKSYINRDRYTFELAPTNSGAVIDFAFLQETGNRINILGYKETEFKICEGMVIGETEAYLSTASKEAIKEYFVLSVDVPFEEECTKNAISLKIKGKTTSVRLATSFISKEQAMLNYKRELENKSLKDIHALAREEWEKYLSRIEIEDPDEEKKKTFYSCLYRIFCGLVNSTR